MTAQPLTFAKATKKQARLRLALIGPSGSGKTYTGLTLATALAGAGGRVAVIDTERGSASKYADLFVFDVLELQTFSPLTYAEAIRAAVAAGYPVIVVDSLSHAWMGKEGALEQVDKFAKRSQSSNNFAAWRDVTPMHNQLVDTMLQADAHIIATMRAKTEYVLEANERGKMVPRKVGLAPVQRDGLEYEFDIVADMDLDNNLIVSKSRMAGLSGAVMAKPDAKLADRIRAWLTDGAPAIEPVVQPAAEKAPMNTLRAAAPEPAYSVQQIGPDFDNPPAAAKPAQPAAAPARTASPITNGVPRPYTPDVLKVKLEQRAVGHVMDHASQAQIGLVSGMLNACFAGEAAADGKRHTLLGYLTGHESIADVDESVILALLDWLHPEKDSGDHYSPDPLAVKEAALALRAAVVGQGQGELAI